MKAWPLRVAGALVVLACVAGGALQPDTYLSRRDIYRLHLPLREFLAREWSEGRIPTWNALDGLGTSVPGTAVTAAFHPLQALLLVAPPDVALKLQVLLLLVLAGLGAALLARRLGGPEASWWLAGVAFGASGYLVSSADNFTYLHGAALWPWALLTAEKLAERPTAAHATLFGAVLALGVHGGDLQGALLATLIGSTWALALAPSRIRVVTQLALAGLVTALLAAPVLPAIAATALDSGRAAGLSAEEVFRWSLSPVRLLELPLGPLVPVAELDFHGPLLARPLGGHTGALWSASELVGVVVLVLAPLGLLPGARRFAVLALLGLLLALGSSGGVSSLLLHVPGWSAFRYPEKFMPLAVLGLALLAARGASLPVGRGHRWAVAPWAVLLLPFAALVDADTMTRAFEALRTTTDALPPELAERLATSLRASASVGLVACLALGLAAWRWPRRLGWVAVAALTLQLAWGARGLIASRPREELGRAPALLSAVKAAGGERTRLAAWPERYLFRGARFAATEAVTWADFEALAPDHNVRFGVGNISPYLPGAMGPIEATCTLRPLCTTPCARMLGAQLCVVTDDLVKPLAERGAVELARIPNPSLVLLRDDAARPWASVPGARSLGEGETFKSALMSADPRAVLMEERAVDLPPEPNAVTHWVRPRPDLAEIDVALAGDNLLIVAEHCARGWRASIDGAPEMTPLRADGGLCAIPVLAGTHRVTLRYVPPGWPWAWALFALGLAATAVVLVRSGLGNGK